MYGVKLFGYEIAHTLAQMESIAGICLHLIWHRCDTPDVYAIVLLLLTNVQYEKNKTRLEYRKLGWRTILAADQFPSILQSNRHV